MSDTVLIEEEKYIEHIATRKVAVIRKKMMAALRHWLKPFPVKFCAISQMRLGCRESPWQITGSIRPRFMLLLKERIETVLMEQQKKLFEK